MSCPDPCAAVDSHARRLSKFGLPLLIVDGVLLLVLSVVLPLLALLPLTLLLVLPLLLPPCWDRLAFAANTEPVIVVDVTRSSVVAATTMMTNIVDVALVYMYSSYQRYPLYELRITSL